MRNRTVALLFSVSALASTGCIVEAPGGKSEVVAEAKRAAVQRAPSLQVRSGAVLDDKVEVVGATVEPGSLIPGEAVKVITFYKPLTELTEDYEVFVHAEDVDGRVERMNLDHRPSAGPTSSWKKGETVRDEFQLYLAPGTQARGISLWVGLWHPPTGARLKISNPDAVRTDGKDRLMLVQVPTQAF